MRAVIIIFTCGVMTVLAFRKKRTAPPTPAPTPEGTVKRVVWGGRARGQSNYKQKDGSTNVWKRRPEWSKYERCTGEACEECDGRPGCWYGDGGWMDVMETNTTDPVQYVNYTLVAHAKCNPGFTGSSFGVRVYSPANGSLKIFWDSELVRTVSDGQERVDFGTRLLPDTAKELRLTWTPTQPTQKNSWVQVSVWASDVSGGFTQCQDQDACLERLATEPHSEAGLELREKNHLLKQCLDGNVQSFSTELALKCADWLECIGDGAMREHFEHVLNAARVDEHDKTSLLDSSRTMSDESCFEHKQHRGGNIDVLRHVKSASDCQLKCQDHPECGIFEYVPKKKRCKIKCAVDDNCMSSKSGATTLKAGSSAKIISGPKYCATAAPVESSRVARRSGKTAAPVIPDFPGCIDPAIADVFSWECDCYDDAVKQCGIDPKFACMSTTDCLNSILCKSDKVCPSWMRRTGCEMQRTECDLDAQDSALELAVNDSENSGQKQQALTQHASSHMELRTLDRSLGSKGCI